MPTVEIKDVIDDSNSESTSAEEEKSSDALNSYEQRQERRRQRYERLSGKARQEAAAADQAADRIASLIPFGQPILVGHHSEGRHRRDLKRIQRKTEQAIEGWEKSDYYAQKAAAVGTGGISSDDPDAVDKLKAKLVELEENHARMKAANKAARGTYPSYMLQNSNANIRRIRERITELEKAADRQSIEVKVNGLTIRQDVEDNRVMLIFDETPPPEIRALCSKQGFKWSRSRQAWVRFLNNAGIYAAEIVRQAFAGEA
jgi:frataxin-like iron-binding protein CyaY